MSKAVCSSDQLTLWDVGRQTVTVDFSGGAVVSDAGLLAVRRLDRKLGVLRGAVQRLPDPRAQLFITHSAERILTQRVYQILGGYFDGNDALRESESPEAALARDQLSAQIDLAIADLPDDLRSAVTLREFDGLSYEQIAEIMDCPVGTVRSRIFRARESIDKRIEPLLLRRRS